MFSNYSKTFSNVHSNLNVSNFIYNYSVTKNVQYFTHVLSSITLSPCYHRTENWQLEIFSLSGSHAVVAYEGTEEEVDRKKSNYKRDDFEMLEVWTDTNKDSADWYENKQGSGVKGFVCGRRQICGEREKHVKFILTVCSRELDNWSSRSQLTDWVSEGTYREGAGDSYNLTHCLCEGEEVKEGSFQGRYTHTQYAWEWREL